MTAYLIRLSILHFALVMSLAVVFVVAWGYRKGGLEDDLEGNNKLFQRWRQPFVGFAMIAIASTAYEKCGQEWICLASATVAGICVSFFGIIIFCLPTSILWRLWREFLPSIRILTPAAILRAVPLVAVWIAGIAGFFGLSAFAAEQTPKPEGIFEQLSQTHLIQICFFTIVGFALYVLWASKKPYAVMMRGILLLVFTCCIGAGIGALVWWMTHMDAVYFASGIS